MRDGIFSKGRHIVKISKPIYMCYFVLMIF